MINKKALEEAFIRAIETKKESLNSMEDTECYNQTLIDMKEQYRKDIEMFMKETLLNSNNMQNFACISGAYQAK